MKYFVICLLKRLHRHVFGGKWGWLYQYRELIMQEKALAILLTLLLGTIWFIVGAFISVWIYDGVKPPAYLFYTLISIPPAFFVFNWLAALYEIYNTERMATWNTLSERHR